MLFLVFQLGHDRYALDVAQIAEVLPLVGIRHLPRAPAGVAGLFDCRGMPVPVIDLSQLALGRPAEPRLSTRIVIVHYPDGTGNTHLLGLIAEKVTETVRHEPSDFVDSGIANTSTPYLGPVATDRRGLLQWIDVGKLMPAAVRDVLFAPLVTD